MGPDQLAGSQFHIKYYLAHDNIKIGKIHDSQFQNDGYFLHLSIVQKLPKSLHYRPQKLYDAYHLRLVVRAYCLCLQLSIFRAATNYGYVKELRCD